MQCIDCKQRKDWGGNKLKKKILRKKAAYLLSGILFLGLFTGISPMTVIAGTCDEILAAIERGESSYAFQGSMINSDGANLIIPAGFKLELTNTTNTVYLNNTRIINNGTTQINEGCTAMMYYYGGQDFINNGQMIINGSFKCDEDIPFVNNGTIQINDSGKLIKDGSGEFHNVGTINNYGTIENNSGTFTTETEISGTVTGRNTFVCNSISVTGIDEPEANTNLDQDAVCTSVGIDSTNPPEIAWSPSDTTAANGTIYTVDITLSVAEHYSFAEDTVVTVNGNTATNFGLNDDGTISVTYEFAATEKGTQSAPNVSGGIGSAINNTDTTMEYAASATAATWMTCTADSTPVTAGTWYVRYKETDTQKASPATEVMVTAPTYTIGVDDDSLTFNTRNEGYTTDDLSQGVTITNTGNSEVSLQTPTSTSFELSLSANKIAAGQTATLTITPKAGLASDEYNEAIEIKTTQNASVNVAVSFKVNRALTVSINASATEIVAGESVTLTADVQGGGGTYFYWWSGVDDQTLQGKNTTTYSPTTTTTYRLSVTDTIDYNKEARVTITVIPKKGDLTPPTDKNDSSAETGDSTPLILCAALLLISAITLLGLNIRKRKTNHR